MNGNQQITSLAVQPKQVSKKKSLPYCTRNHEKAMA